MTNSAKHVPVNVRLRLELASVSLQVADSQHQARFPMEPAAILGGLLICMAGTQNPLPQREPHLRSWDRRLSALRSFWTCSAQMSYTGEALSTCQGKIKALKHCLACACRLLYAPGFK